MEEAEEEPWDIDGEVDETVAQLREKVLHGGTWNNEDQFQLISALESFILKTRADQLNFQRDIMQQMINIIDGQTQTVELVNLLIDLMRKEKNE